MTRAAWTDGAYRNVQVKPVMPAVLQMTVKFQYQTSTIVPPVTTTFNSPYAVENYAYDATNIRLREVTFGYTFRNLLGAGKNLTAIISRNLFFFHKDTIEIRMYRQVQVMECRVCSMLHCLPRAAWS